MRAEEKFTRHEKDIAIKVFMESRMVRHWAESQAELLGVDLNTPKGQEFYNRERRAYAEKLMK